MNQQTAPNPVDELHMMASQVRQQYRESSEMKGIARHAQLDMARVVVEIAECDMLLQHKESVQQAILALQMKVQAKNKGVFEDLLTNLIHEIMPAKSGDKIVLTSSMRNNLAALDVDILSGGNLENVSKDRGGSIANIIAMGLRFVVLARHPNRRVLFLDEADCHLAEMYIPAFAAVMQQLAHRLGIQVVYISHKPAAYFAGYARIIEIYNDEGKTHSRAISDEVLDDSVEYPDSALRYIRLKDFGPHENILVELGPGVNVIIGDNDLGKSKFITAISELLDNDGSESRIRHQRPEFEVEVGLEEGMTLIWKYLRVGKNRTSLVLKDKHGQTIETSNSGKDVPDWLHTYLAMGRVHGHDIHVHPQDEPKYLLSSHYTSIERAKMFPLGRESRDVQRMLQQFQQQVKDTTERKTLLSKELNRIKNLLKILAPVLENETDLLARHEQLIALCEKNKAIKRLGVNMANAEKMVKVLREGLDKINRHIVVPVQPMATEQMKTLIANIEHSEAMIKALKPVRDLPPAPKAPVLADISAIKKLGVRWAHSIKMVEILRDVCHHEPVVVPVIRDLSSHADLIERMSKNQADIASRKEKIEACNQKAIVLTERQEALMLQMGGVCPTCQQSFEGHTHA